MRAFTHTSPDVCGAVWRERDAIARCARTTCATPAVGIRAAVTAHTVVSWGRRRKHEWRRANGRIGDEDGEYHKK
eukprot:1404997-Prymnesium_polylepis.1